MPAILTQTTNMVDAASFMERLSKDECHLYVAVGHPDPWLGSCQAEIDNYDKVPPTPDTSLKTEREFRANLIGMRRVHPYHVMLVLPRQSSMFGPDGEPEWSVDWKIGAKYNPLPYETPNPWVIGNNNCFYCLTSDFHVYKCLEAGTGGVQAFCEPSAMFGPNSKYEKYVETDDGYKWEFQYDVTAGFINLGMLIDYWIPVPYGRHILDPNRVPSNVDIDTGTLTANQISYGNCYANYDLGAHHVFVNVKIGNEGDAIPYDISYRQVGLILDPRDRRGDLLTGERYAAIHNDAIASGDDFDVYSGHTLYIDNCRVKTRQENQSEQFLAVLTF